MTGDGEREGMTGEWWDDGGEGCGVLRTIVSCLDSGSGLTSGFASTLGSLELEAPGDEVTRCRASSKAV